MFGLCPFHSEKTPSFSVSPDKQIYHCFGCGKGGGVISFIMEIENLSFPEAVAFLARRANMPLPEQEDTRESKKRSRLLALNRDAARFFYEQLNSPAGERARQYMARRGIAKGTAVNFGLGCAPDDWGALERAMREKGYTDYELFDAGLIKKGRNGGWYDTFRDRLVFPVIDVRGNVIGFSGRILGENGPKYLNSPETPVFNKGRNLFALNLAKKSKKGYILLTEGNIDVVSLHQAGFDSAVASLGTSLTAEQARLISRYTDRVVIAYDNDAAGQKAAQRAIAILEKLDLKVRVLQMSGAKDPDEFIRLKGAEGFERLIEGSENQTEYLLAQIGGAARPAAERGRARDLLPPHRRRGRHQPAGPHRRGGLPPQAHPAPGREDRGPRQPRAGQPARGAAAALRRPGLGRGRRGRDPSALSRAGARLLAAAARAGGILLAGARTHLRGAAAPPARGQGRDRRRARRRA